MTDPFKIIQENIVKAKERTKKVVANLTGASDKRMRDEHIAEMTADAAECQIMLNSDMFPRIKKYLENLQNTMSQRLRQLAARFEESNKLEIARLGGKIELLDEIMNHPERVVKELEQMEKELLK